jgi:mono/diheme cytochrome c family protein
MRHLMANIFTYAIAISLFVGAALFGRMRASQYVLTKESVMLAQHGAGMQRFESPEFGEDVYRRNCAACHGEEGRGWDQYPGLGHAGHLLLVDGGHNYLIDVHLHGLASPRWRAPMPPMRHMHDVELAAVINYIVTEFGIVDSAVPLFAPGDIAARRAARLSPAAVNNTRPPLAADDATPP